MAAKKKKATPKKDVAVDVSYWTPPVKKPGEFPVSKAKKPKKTEPEHSYYIPPKTPQEAIDRGIVSTEAIRPKNFLPHHKRLSPSSRPNPRSWHCWWGCEGVNHPVFSTEWPKATHDYYCPYWELLALFPEWQDDFELKPWHRPPRPPEEKAVGWPPNDQWNRTEWYGAETEATIAIDTAVKAKAESLRLGGIVNQENPLHSKPRKRNSGGRGSAVNLPRNTRKGVRDIGGGFTITDDKPRNSSSGKRGTQ